MGFIDLSGWSRVPERSPDAALKRCSTLLFQLFPQPLEASFNRRLRLAGPCNEAVRKTRARGERYTALHLIMNNQRGFTPAELRKLRSLKDPYGIQRFLDDMPYHLTDTAWSPRRVLRENTAHCFEGAIFAAAALRT